ncbi:hypothetical protein LDENG_00127590, partial [Lucifuga dentata]
KSTPSRPDADICNISNSFNIPVKIIYRCPVRSTVKQTGAHPRNLINVQYAVNPAEGNSSSLPLNFALLNIRSLTNKSFYINDFISQYGLHMLFLTECWLSSTAAVTLIEASPPDYSFLFSARQGKKGGGIATVFSNMFTCTKCAFGDFSTFEYLAMVIRTQQHILTVTIYRPPKHNPNFLSEFSQLLTIALVKYDRVILLGDFNLHVND